jgi:hypothetical protein
METMQNTLNGEQPKLYYSRERLVEIFQNFQAASLAHAEQPPPWSYILKRLQEVKAVSQVLSNVILDKPIEPLFYKYPSDAGREALTSTSFLLAPTSAHHSKGTRGSIVQQRIHPNSMSEAIQFQSFTDQGNMIGLERRLSPLDESSLYQGAHQRLAEEFQAATASPVPIFGSLYPGMVEHEVQIMSRPKHPSIAGPSIHYSEAEFDDMRASSQMMPKPASFSNTTGMTESLHQAPSYLFPSSGYRQTMYARPPVRVIKRQSTRKK